MTPLETDITSILRPGIFLLRRADRVVYIAKTKCLLLAIANLRAMDRFSSLTHLPLPRIHFDSISIIPCASDRAAELLPALIALHNPAHNRPAPTTPEPIAAPVLRRKLRSASCTSP